jgi:hypothetical protein
MKESREDGLKDEKQTVQTVQEAMEVVGELLLGDDCLSVQIQHYSGFNEGLEAEQVWMVWFLREQGAYDYGNVVSYGEHEELPMALCISAEKFKSKETLKLPEKRGEVLRLEAYRELVVELLGVLEEGLEKMKEVE